MRRRRGWVFIDVMMAMILVSLIALTLSLAVGWHRRALMHLADTRAATDLSESALISLQSGQSLPPAGDAKLTFHKLSTPTEIPGKSWVEVEAIVNNHRATLIGLVSQNSLPAGGS